MFIGNPCKLLFQVLLLGFRSLPVLGRESDIVIQLLERQFSIDDLLLLGLEIPFEIRELAVESCQSRSFGLELRFGGFVIVLPGLQWEPQTLLCALTC